MADFAECSERNGAGLARGRGQRHVGTVGAGAASGSFVQSSDERKLRFPGAIVQKKAAWRGLI
jgi:hypothetical protein